MSSIFTKILAGEIPGRFIYRDETKAAFLDAFPNTPGHTLIVPIAEVDHFTDLDPKVWQECTELAQKIGIACRKAFDAPRAALMIAGFEVPHTHIHVFPAWSMEDITNPPKPQLTPEEMDEAQQRLIRALDL